MSASHWKGKTALVTGASAGIGAAFAKLLAQAGCHLILTARRRDRLDAIAGELAAAHGVRVDVIDQDLSIDGAGQAIARRTAELGREVDLLVNNAGFGLSGTFASLPWERQRDMMMLNTVGLAELTRFIAPPMIARHSGHILMVSSIACFQPMPTFAIYAATKAFVTSFGLALGHELRPRGVRVTVSLPGGTETEFFEVGGLKETRVRRLGVMSAEAVARLSLRAAAWGCRSIVTGWLNRVMTLLAALLPMPLRLRAAVIFQKLAGGGE